MSGPIDITPEYKLAELLSDFTGREFSPAALLSTVHALLALSEDDPRRVRLAETFWRAHDAVENGDWSTLPLLSLEFRDQLLQLRQ
jgi:hypothetical protein